MGSGFNSNRFIDMTGQKIGRWTVLEFGHWKVNKNGYKHAYWKCQCECGTVKEVNGSSLRNGKSLSCGCYSVECTKDRNSKVNTYDLSGEYGIGYTSKNEKFLFDLEDYEKIKDYSWYINKDGYLYANDNNRKKILMHRVIMGETRKSITIDHISHNCFDNRKSNLRRATRPQNGANTKLKSNNSSGYTGVHLRSDTHKWSAELICNGKKHCLGSYLTMEEAIKARKIAEEKYFGEFSYENSINKTKEIIKNG